MIEVCSFVVLASELNSYGVTTAWSTQLITIEPVFGCNTDMAFQSNIVACCLRISLLSSFILHSRSYSVLGAGNSIVCPITSCWSVSAVSS